MFFPRRLKNYAYRIVFGFQLDSSAIIGYSIILPKALLMGEGSRIGHLTIVKGITLLSLGRFSSLGNLNWVTGFPKDTQSPHFGDQPDRRPELIIGDHSAITNRHLIDCTDSVSIGRFTTFAGFRSQILTHSISPLEARQRSGPVTLGDYCFVGTGSIFLPNTGLPSHSILGAGAVLTSKFHDEFWLYGGTPAKAVQPLSRDLLYFHRKKGFII